MSTFILNISSSLLNTNSSIFSYIRYRQYLLFIYAICVLIIVFLAVNTLVLYSLGNLLHNDYITNASFCSNIYSRDSILFSYLLSGSLYDYVRMLSVIGTCDSYMLNLLFLPSAGEISHTSYFMSYNLYGWFETCGSCSGRSNLNMSVNTYFDEICCMGLVYNDHVIDFGSFTSANGSNTYSNYMGSGTFMASTPYMYEDCGLLTIKYLYTNIQNSLNSCLSNFIFYDESISNLFKFKGTPILEIFKLNMSFDTSGYTVGAYSKVAGRALTCFDYGYGGLNIHRINVLTKYDDGILLPLDTYLDSLGCYNIRNSSCSSYLHISELITQVICSSDHLFDILNLYGGVCSNSCNSSFSTSSYIKVHTMQSYCDIQLYRIGRRGIAFFYGRSLSSAQSNIFNYTNFFSKCRLNFELVPGSTNYNDSLVPSKFSELGFYFYNTRCYKPDSMVRDNMYDCCINTYYSVLYDYSYGISDMYVKLDSASSIKSMHCSLNTSNNFISTVPSLNGFKLSSIIDNFYINLFSRCTDGLLRNYRLHTLPSFYNSGSTYIDHPKYYTSNNIFNNLSICTFLLNCEFDTVIPCTLDGIPNLFSFYSDISSNFEFLDSGKSSLVTLCYGYGMSRSFIFTDNLTYIVENSNNIIRNFGLVSIIYSVIDLDFYAEYILYTCSKLINFYKTCFMLKFICLLYPFVFVVLVLLLVMHILYAYEFLLNDYIECIQFRKFISYTLLLCVSIYIYFVIFNLYLSDFYGLSMIFGNNPSSHGEHDLFVGKGLNILNIDEEFIGVYLYNKYISLYMPSSIYIDTDSSTYFLTGLTSCIGPLLYIFNIFGFWCWYPFTISAGLYTIMILLTYVGLTTCIIYVTLYIIN